MAIAQQQLPPARFNRCAGAFVTVSAALLLAACGKNDKPQAVKPPTPEVGIVTVTAQDAPLTLELPGRLSASQVAEIRPQVSGIVKQRLFQEGATVRAGQPLYQIDPASLEATRAGAQAALQRAQALLAVAQTRSARNAELLKLDVISRQVAEDSVAALRQAEADVAVARANLDAAQVQLGYAAIKSPIAGRVDISSVTPGALVTANQTALLTTVQQLDPMQVDIVQSSAELLQLRRQLEGKGDGKGDGKGSPGASRQIRLLLEDGSEHPQAGALQVSGVTVDRGTGAVTLRGTVPNPKGTLLPGMVVRARLLAGVTPGAILVPQQGVSRSPTGNATALVLGEGNKVEQRRLTLARAVGNQWLVSQGLVAGDRLIVEGLQRTRPGQVVTPVPANLQGGGDKAKRAGGAASGPKAGPSASAPGSAHPAALKASGT